MPPLSNAQKALVAQFVAITGTNDKVAQRFLKNANYRLDLATNNYLNSGGADTGRIASIEKAYDELVTSSNGDNKESLSAETTQDYLESLGVNMENAELFVMMELVQAPGIGEITRQGFIDGWKATDLTAFSKTAQKNYIRQKVAQLSTDLAYFRKVYRHAFIAGKEANQKALPLENALVFWQLLFSPPGRPWKSANRDWAALWETFLNEKWTRSVNKDMWNMTLEFANKSMDDETLGFYSEEDSWPAVIDEFVSWYRQRDAMDTN
ncbi:Defective in cullin neddylation protein 1 [Cytospora mali]|uniref:Defective in cullin neddylation protein n=1 Tax=Cytospora mali TaxID=578113 RepID=A0A194V4B7_CYTMA|nr:Defective in cullin neddylation protein 1 [Valsa mali var. pyri (nom. inval.)]